MNEVHSLSSKYYEYKDFEDIIFNGFDQQLSIEIIENLKDLQKKLGISLNQTNANTNVNNQRKNNYHASQTPKQNWKTNHLEQNKDNNQNGKINNENQEEIKFSKRGLNAQTSDADVSPNRDLTVSSLNIEKDLSTLRVSLNKISEKNFKNQSDVILELIDPYIVDESRNKYLAKFAQTIFEISSTNSFLSELNAKLYGLFINKSNLFSGFLEEFIVSYKRMYVFDNMQAEKLTCESCSTTPCKTCLENYQNKLNKLNDRRKAITNFLVDLMKEGVIQLNTVLECLMSLFDIFEEWIEVKNRVLEVDELVENIFLFLTKAQTELKGHSDWDEIYEDKVCVYGEFKCKEKNSLSSRAIFKFKDLLDLL
jgi:hypothetical protein